MTKLSKYNDFLLEKEFNWKGVAIDILKHFADDYNINRSNHCIHGDAFSYNWDKYLEKNNFLLDVKNKKYVLNNNINVNINNNFNLFPHNF